MSGFSNAVIGGAETLIRSAMKSVNYVLGLTGWRLTRDGDAEFNSAVIRGSVSAGGGTVLLNAGGLHIENGTDQFDINFAGGFLARHDPVDGVQSQMTPGLLVISDTITVGNRIINSGTGMDYSSSQIFSGITGVAVGNSYIASGFINYPTPFPVGRTLKGFVNITNGAGTSAGWVAKWVPQDNTKCQVFLMNSQAGGGSTAINVSYDIFVFVI